MGVTANATDPDGNIVSYSLTDDAGGRFVINASSGVVTVATGAVFSIASNPTHSITVQASDGLGGLSSASFTVTVVPLNHPPTLDSLAPLAP